MSDRWVKVQDKLPEHGQKVICYGKSWGMNFSMVYIDFDGKTKFANVIAGCFDNPDVTHWQPLPEPPKEASNA